MTRKTTNRTVLCGGCFNIVHEGHLYFLQHAKELGKKLVVVIASDAHNKKPYARPSAMRARSVRALGIADKVIIGDSRNFLATVSKVKPNIIVLGYDQTLPQDVAEKINSRKIKIKRIKQYRKISTSSLAAKRRINHRP